MIDKHTELDLNWFYYHTDRLGVKPTLDDEEHFLECLSKLTADDIDNAHRRAFNEIYPTTFTIP